MRLVCSQEAGALVLALADPEAFGDFAIEAPAGLSLAGLSLAGAGQSVAGEREEIDVSVALVRGLARELGRPSAWFEDFDAMLAKVVPFGWYDEAADTIRAHVVRSS